MSEVSEESRVRGYEILDGTGSVVVSTVNTEPLFTCPEFYFGDRTTGEQKIGKLAVWAIIVIDGSRVIKLGRLTVKEGILSIAISGMKNICFRENENEAGSMGKVGSNIPECDNNIRLEGVAPWQATITATDNCFLIANGAGIPGKEILYDQEYEPPKVAPTTVYAKIDNVKTVGAVDVVPASARESMSVAA